MTPEQALAHLRERGVILSGEGDRLRVKAPTGAVSEELRDWLLRHKAELLQVVATPLPPELTSEDAEAVLDAIEERAAIREYDGGETREEAEEHARSAMRIFRYRLTDNPQTWLTLICPGCGMDEARHVLALRFGERLEDVIEYRPILP